ncbi:MAG: SPFH domain-containing protein [bacterium]|nr:SPFH domain-containing protein [bacterium]
MFWLLSAVWAGLYFVVTWVAGPRLGWPTFWALPVCLAGFPVIYFLAGVNIINEWNRRPVLLFGKYSKTAGPGFCWVDPAFHTVLGDLAVQDVVNELRVENVQTHDNVRLHIVGVLTVRLHPDNVKKCVVEVSDVQSAMMQRAISAITEVVGLNSLDYMLHHRLEFSVKAKESLQAKIESWGLDVRALEIKDFKIADSDIEKSIAMKARAVKEAEAELTRAEMQLQIANKLKEAAGAFDEPTWRLKGLETLIELCRSANNNTVLIPSDVMSVLAKLGIEGKTPGKS